MSIGMSFLNTFDKSFCLKHNKSMKSFLLSIILMLSPLLAGANKEVFVLADTTCIFEEASYSSSQLAELEYGDQLTLLEEEITNGFYHVEFVENEMAIQGYVPADIVGEKPDEQDVIIGYNASLLQDAEVLSLTDDKPICTLKKGTRVFLYEGYDKSLDTLSIKFYHEGKVLLGKVSTDAVKPDGVNPGLIVAIMAIVAIVTIIIILFGITKKKRHKKLKTEN